ncbi:MAG: (4Fe-4S)-binding protein [Lachnospiraceae bacterium]|nr:(4Fe-4S)-binding protein [Lachnospiraceae bacterium]
MACTISKEEIARVKGLGFLNNKGTDEFNGRVITRNGKITSKQMITIAEAAEKFGNGEVVFTTRLTVEVRGVHFDNIEPMREYLAQAGLATGGTGAKVRPVVSCKGTTCQYGLYDTFALSEKIHEKFYVGYHDVKLPHKFKIATGGCRNNCVKPDLNDIGIIGTRMKNEEGVAVTGYKVCIGGRWGKKTALGQPLSKIFTSEDEVLDIVEKVILFYKEQGNEKERLADTIDRIGFEEVDRILLSNELLERKTEILSK